MRSLCADHKEKVADNIKRIIQNVGFCTEVKHSYKQAEAAANLWHMHWISPRHIFNSSRMWRMAQSRREPDLMAYKCAAKQQYEQALTGHRFLINFLHQVYQGKGLMASEINKAHETHENFVSSIQQLAWFVGTGLWCWECSITPETVRCVSWPRQTFGGSLWKEQVPSMNSSATRPLIDYLLCLQAQHLLSECSLIFHLSRTTWTVDGSKKQLNFSPVQYLRGATEPDWD